MSKSHKNVHVGGQQMPLFVPPSTWKRPTELPDLRGCKRIALDREGKDDGLNAGVGPGWATKSGYTCGLAIAWDGGRVYAPTRHPDTDNFDPEQVAQWEKDHQRAGVRMTFQNANYDIGWGTTDGVPVPPEELVDDTMAAAVLVDEERLTYNLDALCKWRGLPGKDESGFREAAASYGFHGSEVKKNLWRLPARFVGPYAEQDAGSTYDLHDNLQIALEEQELVPAYRLEMDLVPMVVHMRLRGIRVDVEAASRAYPDLIARRDTVFRDLAERLGVRVGMEEIGKTSWLFDTFQRVAKEINIPRTENGSPSFTAGSTGWMQKHPHWLPKLVVEADKLNNAAEKFVKGFILDYAHRGRLHAGINQFLQEDAAGVIRGTRTFRFSYSDPPLQQMPARDELIAALIRGLFLPEKGEWWLGADYSQQEYRLIVHFAAILGCSKAAEAVARYVNNPATDYHSMVAEMTGLERKPAKDTNFAKSYGAGIPKFASMINKTVEEARDIMEQYDREMPFVKQLAEKCQSLGARRGYIRLLDGARSHFGSWERAWRGKGMPYEAPAHSEEAARARWPGERIKRAFTKDAMNRLIQGSAARQTKLAMRECWREKVLPLIQMHDELGFSVSDPAVGARVTELMREVVKLRVPMKVDAEYGRSWGLAKHTWEERDAA